MKLFRLDSRTRPPRDLVPSGRSLAGEPHSSRDVLLRSITNHHERALVILCLVAVAVKIARSVYLASPDDYAHLNRAREAWGDIGIAFGVWERPGLTLPLMLVAPFGIVVARSAMAAVTVLTAWIASREAPVERRPAAFLLLFSATEVFLQGMNLCAEPVAAFFLALWLRSSRRGAWLAPGLLLGAAASTRTELTLLIPILGLLSPRRMHTIGAAAGVVLAMNLGRVLLADASAVQLLHPFDSFLGFVGGAGPEDLGLLPLSWEPRRFIPPTHYLFCLPAIIGPFLFLLVASARLSSLTSRDRTIVAGVVATLGAVSFLAWQGIPSTTPPCGLLRHPVALVPLLVVLLGGSFHWVRGSVICALWGVVQLTGTDILHNLGARALAVALFDVAVFAVCVAFLESRTARWRVTVLLLAGVLQLAFTFLYVPAQDADSKSDWARHDAVVRAVPGIGLEGPVAIVGGFGITYDANLPYPDGLEPAWFGSRLSPGWAVVDEGREDHGRALEFLATRGAARPVEQPALEAHGYRLWEVVEPEVLRTEKGRPPTR